MMHSTRRHVTTILTTVCAAAGAAVLLAAAAHRIAIPSPAAAAPAPQLATPAPTQTQSPPTIAPHSTMAPTSTTAPPPTHGIFGHLPACDSAASLEASAREVRLGDLITVVATNRVACPRLLESSAALFVVGGVPPWAVPIVNEGIEKIIRTVHLAGGGPIAYRFVGDDGAAVTWAAVAGDGAVMPDALRLEAERPGGTAAQWTAALMAARQAIGTLPTAYRPLLVVVDGRPPEAGRERLVDDLAAAIESAGDRAGRSVLIDGSDDGWLTAEPKIITALRDQAVVVRTTRRDDAWAPVDLSRALASFQSPLEAWTGELLADETVLKALSASPAPDVHQNLALVWNRAATGFAAAFEVRAVYRVVSAPPNAVLHFFAIPSRHGAPPQDERDVSVRLSIAPPPAGTPPPLEALRRIFLPIEQP